jgi:cation:H+ antiporter
MNRFLMLVGFALAAMIPALFTRVTGWKLPPLAAASIFGIAVVAAGFMLSWGAETAEKHISQGLILAAVALVTVLPEYAVDMYYAFQAGDAPESRYVHYAAANMTGANRMLVGLAWPMIILLHWWRNRERQIVLGHANAIEIGFLLLASLYGIVILVKNRIDLLDFAVLLALFVAYLWQVGRNPNAEGNDAFDEDDEPGPAAALSALSPRAQWAWMVGLGVLAALAILMSAEPFAEAIVASGRQIGIDEFLLIQWIAPIASEAPSISIAILFVLSQRAGSALTAMISDKINQWTLLVGMLPLAMSFGAGHVIGLPLDGRQHEEFFLTAAQSIFALSLLLRLRFSLWSGLLLVVLFAGQVVIAFLFRHDEAQVISSLTMLGWAYLALSVPLFLKELRGLASVIRAVVRGTASVQ